MHIEFDYDLTSDGILVATHFIDTDDAHSMDVITKLLSGALKASGTGWEVMSKHPSYDSKSRLHVVVEEMKRLGVKQ